LRVIKAYGSRGGDYIANVELTKYNCGEIPDDPFQEQYFAIPARLPVRFMSLRLTLIDAGDYDDSGKSELVFFDKSEGGDDDNSDGYSIWDSGFECKAQRLWFYH
jgi:hypothetical protein